MQSGFYEVVYISTYEELFDISDNEYNMSAAVAKIKTSIFGHVGL